MDDKYLKVLKVKTTILQQTYSNYEVLISNWLAVLGALHTQFLKVLINNLCKMLSLIFLLLYA